ncbi:EF-hand domain-containing protein [Winogradskyella aurantia]|uniref:EF-hand domain-containing protein n=1 Tax=Winogradskyella aurantia TaxID=1915063 RepID=A0A265UUU3_9FLAO|nr:EF-hand domain-containing protein [Winogradskyella aurantia]OZV69076.1 hypothetical protein CA834_06340 [Winogradskyella aurantia]
MISKTVRVSFIIVVMFGYFTSQAQQERKRELHPETILSKMDTDENGTVSLDEFKATRRNKNLKVEVVEKRFKLMDEDASGEVDLDELKKAMKHMKRHRGPHSNSRAH